jgi:cysteine desulfuration protein SufE
LTLDDLIEAFDDLPDWEERYRTIIDLGRSLPPMPEALKTEENKVRGCMSQVWMSVKSADPFDFWVDSDSVLVKGLAAVLRLLYGGRPASAIPQVDAVSVFRRLDLENHITPNRRNGFFSMMERIKALGKQESSS